MKRTFKSKRGLKSTLIIIVFVTISQFVSAVQVPGELKMWRKVSLTFDGPSVDESESTFRNYRLDVTIYWSPIAGPLTLKKT